MEVGKNQKKKKKHEEKGSHLGTFPFWKQSSLHFFVEKQQQKKKLILACFRHKVGIPGWPHDRIVFQETEEFV